jgi:hypothetical membrane protein
MLPSDRKLAGLLAFIGGVECLLGISIAEELYPNYSVSANYISDLGATCRSGLRSNTIPSGTCSIVEPSSIIFNTSVALLGVLVIVGSYFLYRSTRDKTFAILLILAGVGALGVGFLPETTGEAHAIVSLIVFLFGGLSAVTSFKFQEVSMNYLSVLLGAITLAALGLFVSGNYLSLGQGGMERMIAYPALFWFVGFGSHLMNSQENADNVEAYLKRSYVRRTTSNG